MPGRALSDDERLDCLRLARSENVGPITYRALIRHFGAARAALVAAPDLSRRGGRSRAIRIASREDAEREMAALAQIGAKLIAWGEPDYPEALAAIADPPPLIAVRGNAELLAKRAIAVVGARNASAAGRKFARDIAGELGRAGLIVVSGLARGIDGAAHTGALDTGTVAVVAGGVDIVYPLEHASLYDQIVARGAAISEQPLGVEPQARHFPPRNRLISGLSLGVLVVEAAPRSGSLITARLALEQGREVFAVPGSPLDPRCRGTNDLIRRGAVLTESAADVLDALTAILAPRVAAPHTPEFAGEPAENIEETTLDTARAEILSRLGPTGVTVDELIRQCQMSPPVVLTVLLELELAGRLERQPGNRIALL